MSAEAVLDAAPASAIKTPAINPRTIIRGIPSFAFVTPRSDVNAAISAGVFIKSFPFNFFLYIIAHRREFFNKKMMIKMYQKPTRGIHIEREVIK